MLQEIARKIDERLRIVNNLHINSHLCNFNRALKGQSLADNISITDTTSNVSHHHLRDTVTH